MTASRVTLATTINRVIVNYASQHKTLPVNSVMRVTDLPFTTATTWDEIESYVLPAPYTATELDAEYSNKFIAFFCPGCGSKQAATYRQLGGVYCQSANPACPFHKAGTAARTPPLTPLTLAKRCWLGGLRYIPNATGAVGQLASLRTECRTCHHVHDATPQTRDRANAQNETRYLCTQGACRTSFLASDSDDGQAPVSEVGKPVPGLCQPGHTTLLGRGSNHTVDLKYIGFKMDRPVSDFSTPFTLICHLGHHTIGVTLGNLAKWNKGGVKKHPCTTCASGVFTEDILAQLADVGIPPARVNYATGQVLQLTTPITVSCASGHLTSGDPARFIQQVRRRGTGDMMWHCAQCKDQLLTTNETDDLHKLALASRHTVTVVTGDRVSVACMDCQTPQLVGLKAVLDGSTIIQCPNCTNRALTQAIAAQLTRPKKAYVLSNKQVVHVEGYEGPVIDWLINEQKVQPNDIISGHDVLHAKHYIRMRRSDNKISVGFPDLVIKSRAIYIEVKPMDADARPDEMEHVRAKCRAYVHEPTVKEAHLISVGMAAPKDTTQRNRLAVLMRERWVAADQPSLRESFGVAAVRAAIVGVIPRAPLLNVSAPMEDVVPPVVQLATVIPPPADMEEEKERWASTGLPYSVDVSTEGNVRLTADGTRLRLKIYATREPTVSMPGPDGDPIVATIGVLMANAFRVPNYGMLKSKSASCRWMNDGRRVLANLQVQTRANEAQAKRDQVGDTLTPELLALRESLLQHGRVSEQKVREVVGGMTKVQWKEAGKVLGVPNKLTGTKAEAVESLVVAVRSILAP